MVSQEFDIVGIGNAIVDVITDVNDEFINQQELRKGLMSLVDLDTIKSLSNKIEIKANVSGGSVANSIVALAQNNIKSAFIGKVGKDGFAAFSGAKQANRALAQSMARELAPKGIHVAHVIVDGAIDTPWVNKLFPEYVKEKKKIDGLMKPDDIAQNYLMIHNQPKNAWTFELDLRPWVETW